MKTLNIEGMLFNIEQKKLEYRARTLLTKEPDTIWWIDHTLQEGDVFYDIGANIGCYSIYAAHRKNSVVYAFEPESSNYYYLNTNIHLNNFDNKIKALCLALNNCVQLSTLNLHSVEPGDALHCFDSDLDYRHQPFTPVFKQAVLGLPLDHIISEYQIEKPNHIKIDVDGNEHRIISGMRNTLDSNELKSIAIELNMDLAADQKIARILVEHGFFQDSRPELVNLNNKGKFKNIINYYFFREPV